jgi:hypothetical protein
MSTSSAVLVLIEEQEQRAWDAPENAQKHRARGWFRFWLRKSARNRGVGAWAYSSIREMLRRDRCYFETQTACKLLDMRVQASLARLLMPRAA